LFLYNQFNFKYNIVLNFFHYINYTMNTEALFLFLILLLGLVLCSFLGGNCNKEGFDSISGMFDAGANAVDSVVGDTANAVGSVVGTTANAVNTVVGGTANVIGSAANSVANGFDNYNHYNGSGSSSQLQNGMVFTDASGDTVTVVINSNGTQSLQMLQKGQTTPMVLSSTPPASSSVAAAPNTFYAPFGNITATVITGSNGQTAIQFNLPNGQAVIFTQSSGTSTSSTNNSSLTSTQYYGSTGYPIQQAGYSLAYNGPYGGNAGAVTGPYGNTAYYAQGPYGNTVAGMNPYYNGTSSTQYGGSAGAVTGPYGNTAYYAQGPYGNTVAGTSSNNGYGNSYYSTMPQGIPASQIPPGQEDLYILKSEIVPPVCPACPTAASCPRQEKCPPCPACARCPEPSFECKKVPNYNAISDDYLPQPDATSFSQFSSTNNEFLPQPVVNDFSQFGM
jgi:hypothetical protein